MTRTSQPKVLVLCTVQAGLDSIAEVLRRGYSIDAIVGLHPSLADPVKISGWVDVAGFADKRNLKHLYVRSYGMTAPEDAEAIRQIDFELIWVAWWQRLVPQWLIEMSPLGVLGAHGSSDGIHGGRGRSPQNWALMLGCDRSDLSMFRITARVDEGPVLVTRSFSYTEYDDIAVSYHRSALAIANMVVELLSDPGKHDSGSPQPEGAFYFPQRTPQDGWVDWSLPGATIAAHCRALSKPYPGLKSCNGDAKITIWHCIPFDEVIENEPGVIGACFTNGEFLVSCSDGRILVRQWEASAPDWSPMPGFRMEQMSYSEQLTRILERHQKKASGTDGKSQNHTPVEPLYAGRFRFGRRLS